MGKDETLDDRFPTLVPHADSFAQRPNKTIHSSDQEPNDTLTIDRSEAPSLVLEHTLSRGGMAVVHLATQTSLRRKVAVKRVRPEKLDGRAMGRLLREAWITGGLEHPNVPPVYDIALDAEGVPQIVLKRIEGVEWGVLMGAENAVQARFGVPDLMEWNLGVLLQVSNAVRFAHRRGILHRDIKPENVMIGEFGEVVLIDWGIAVSLRGEGRGQLPLAAEVTDVAGTPCYMAP